MGLRIVTNDLKCGTIRVVLRILILEGKYYAYKGIIKKAACSDGAYR